MKLIRLFPLLALSGFFARGADWPQWRGKDRHDHSPDSATLVAWPETGPTRFWLYKDAGVGYSGFSIVNDQLFTMTGKDGRENVFPLDSKTGRELWSTEIDERIYENPWSGGPRSTLTIEDDRAYALSANGVLACLAIKDGNVLWKADPVKDLGGKLQDWGYTESVLVDGNLVVCTPGGSKGTMAAFDKMTGKVLWQSKDLSDAAQYSSPILVEASTSGWKEKCRFKLEPQSTLRKPQGRIWTHPVILDGRLYLRDQDLIYCYDVKAQ